jgi:hypothetical protein
MVRLWIEKANPRQAIRDQYTIADRPRVSTQSTYHFVSVNTGC